MRSPVKPVPPAWQGKSSVRELFDQENGHTYRYVGKDIEWDGRPAHIEYITDISEQKLLEQELDHLVNYIPGGIASFEIRAGSFIPVYISDGVMDISGHTREEYNAMVKNDPLDVIYKADRKRVLSAAVKTLERGEVLDVSYRMRHKNGHLIWIHLNGRWIEATAEASMFYAVFTGMSSESRLYQNITNETADGIPAYVKYIRDTTETVQTRREKERLDLYFRSIVEQFPGGISMMAFYPDGTMRPEFISQGFAAMLQRSVEEAVRLFEEDVFAGIHPDDVKKNWAKLQQFLKSGEGPCELVARMQRKDGNYFWTSSTLSMLSSTDDIRRIYIVYSDISRKVEEQEQLRHRYEEQLLEHYHKTGTNELILGHSNITRNQVVEMRDSTDSELIKRFGTERDTFFKGLAGMILDKEDQKTFLKMFDNESLLEAYAQNRTEQVLNCFIRLPEEEQGRFVQFKVNLMTGPEDGEVIVILTVTDITDETIGERISYRLFVKSHDYVVDVDLFHDSYRVLAYNEDASYIPPLYGVHSKLIADMADTVVLPKDSRQFAKELDLKVIRKSLRNGPYTFTFSTEDQGEIRIKNMTITSIEPRLQRYCMVCADVTFMIAEERRVKKELEMALANAEEANKAKSDFLSAMSHDIRTPMNAIVGMTTLAFSHIDDRARLEDCLQKITVSSRHLLSLVNDVLDMSRIEQSKISLSHIELRFPELVEQLTAILAPQAKEKGVQLSICTKDVVQTAFYGDSLRINQILINLLGNAVKFTPSGGRVDFTAEETAPSRQPENIRYRFTIQDTGIGMSEEFMNHIFEPFTRERMSNRIEGTGLGLSIAKRLVDLMDGNISVESRRDQGTRFTVELEFEKAQSCPAQVESEDAFERKKNNVFVGRRFLAAEDNDINAEILCELLQIEGAVLELREDGVKTVEAFKTAEPGTYDIILMDIQMPGLNGYEATRMIRNMERDDAKTIPIIAMTANAFAEDVQAALEAGMNAHVAKPIDMDILRTALSKVL